MQTHMDIDKQLTIAHGYPHTYRRVVWNTLLRVQDLQTSDISGHLRGTECPSQVQQKGLQYPLMGPRLAKECYCKEQTTDKLIPNELGDDD